MRTKLPVGLNVLLTGPAFSHELAELFYPLDQRQVLLLLFRVVWHVPLSADGLSDAGSRHSISF